MEVCCSLDATFPRNGSGLLVPGYKKCFCSEALGGHQSFRTDGLISSRGTPNGMQDWSRGVSVKLLKGGEGKKIFPVAMQHLSRLGLELDHADGNNKLGEVRNCHAWMVLIEPAKSPGAWVMI